MNSLFANPQWKTRLFWVGLVVSLALAACAGVPAPTPAATQPTPTPAPPPTPGAPGIPQTRIPFLSFGTWQRDVPYCQDGDVALKMDVMYPDASTGAAAPVAVFLHILGGSKDGVEIDGVGELLKRGYVVVAPNWRQPADVKLPIGYGDAKCAIRHLRANAGVYHIDPNRIGAWGSGVGATIAALLGLTKTGAWPEGTSGFSGQSSQVEAVAARDLVGLSSGWQQPELQNYFGVSSANDPILAKTNPITYVAKDAPPFMIFQSDKDDTRPGAMQLYNKLKTASVPATFVEITGCEKCGDRGSPSREERAKMLADFFDQSLK